MLHAQLYTTSSATYRSYSSGGVVEQPAPSPFRSTSAYRQQTNSGYIVSSSKYATAPMHVANGTITTVASKLQSGVLADEQQGYIPNIQPRKNTMEPPINTDPYVPLNETWDLWLVMTILAITYAVYCKRRKVQNKA